MTTPFRTAMPSRAMNPTEAGTDRYSPEMSRPKMPPIMANGMLESPSNAWRTEPKVEKSRKKISARATGTTTIQALIEAAPVMAIKFVGVNLVDGKDVTAKFFKVHLGAPQGVDLVGEGFANMSLTGIMEADEKIVTAGLSQYFTFALED